MPRFNKRGSFGEETTTPVMPLPPAIAGSRGSDDDNHVTQNMHIPKLGDLTDKTTVEEYEHDAVESVPPLGSGSGQNSTAQAGSGPLHPGTILPRHKPALQRLEDLPGLSVVTWETFLDNPSRLCGLFEVDREEFIHYNSEQVNVFFHDSRMEQPTLGAPSGDGLSWTIFIDNYNHLKCVRSWLTERVSVILLHMIRPKTQGAAACLVAINPARKTVGGRLLQAFSSAVDAFLQHRNFCIEIDLNGCVQSWCRTALQVPCEVTGGRIVITNAEERVPCSRVDNVPFCLACFPVWGIRKLSYKYKRQAEYEDIFLAFTAEDLMAGNKSQTLPHSAENSNKNAKSVPASTKAPAKDKGRVWTKSNKHSASSPAMTSGSKDSLDVRANLEVEEVDSGDSRQEGRRPRRYNSKKDKERGQDSGFSSDNASTAERSAEPQLSKGIPDYRRQNHVPPRPSDKTKRTSRNQRILDDASSTSASTSYASSVLSPGPKDGGASGKPAASISWQVVQDVEEEIRDSEFMNLPSNSSSQDSRAEFARTFSVVEPDDDEGDYTLLEESPTSSPRPDTPYHKPLAAQSLKGKRPTMMSQGAAITEERGGKVHSRTGVQPSRTTAGTLPQPRSSLPLHGDSPAQEQGLYAMDNAAFEYDDSFYPTSKAKPGSDLKVQETSRGSKAFPYTSDYLDALGRIPHQSPSYGLVDQDITRGDDLRKKKHSPGKEPADPLFVARDASHYQHDTNVEDTISVYSEEDDMTSPHVRASKGPGIKLKNAGVTWEGDYYDQDEDGEENGLPRILPGARGAQQLRSSREFPAQGGSGDVWKRGGQQYDSRRRYIALNSLRRKSNQQALQAELRKQKQSEQPEPSTSPCELIEF